MTPKFVGFFFKIDKPLTKPTKKKRLKIKN